MLSAVATYTCERLGFLDKTRFDLIKATDPSFCRACCDMLDNDRRFQGRVIVGSGKSLQSCKLEGVCGFGSGGRFTSFIEINCSTLWWMRASSACPDSLRDGSRPVRDTFDDTIWHVLFSMHSSLEELRSFVSWLRPGSIHPTCPCFDSSDLADFSDLLSERRVPVLVDFSSMATGVSTVPSHPGLVSSMTTSSGYIPSLSLRMLAAETREFFAGQCPEDDTLLNLLTPPPIDDNAAPTAPPTEIDESECSPTQPEVPETPLPKRLRVIQVPSSDEEPQPGASTPPVLSEDEAVTPSVLSRSFV